MGKCGLERRRIKNYEIEYYGGRSISISNSCSILFFLLSGTRVQIFGIMCSG
jgi:hypothetical protein